MRLLPLIAFLMVSPAAGQVALWKLGGAGLPFDGSDTTRVIVAIDAAANSLAPRYFTPDENMFLAVDNWSELKNPFELGYVDGHQPRLWTGNGTNVNSTSYFVSPHYVDGLRSTYNTARFGYWTFDIGVPVPAQRFGFSTPTEGFRSDGVPLNQDPVPAFEVSVAAESDPALQLGGYRRLENTIAVVRENFDSEVDIPFPQQYVRFVRYNRNASALDDQTQGGSTTRGTIAEFHLSGQGVPKRAIYVTKIIDLGRPVNFGRIFWKTTALRRIDGVETEVDDAQAFIEVTARAGNDPDPNHYHEYTDSGREYEVTRQRYENELRRPDSVGQQGDVGRRPGLQASITYDTDNWSFWTPVITESGALIDLRNGSHLQLNITLQSRTFDDYIRLDSLWIEQSPLLASRVLGEVAQLDDPLPANGFTQVPLGDMTEFSFDLGAAFDGGGQQGFDSVRLRTGSRPRFVGLYEGDPLQEIAPLDVVESADALEVRLPRRVTPDRNRPLRIVFATELLLFATTFQGEVFDSVQETLPQPIQGGDVTAQVNTNSLRILGSAEQNPELIQKIAFSSPVLTPNGDGANDRLGIAYEIFLLPEPLPVSVKVYGLDGRLLADLPQGLQAAGPQEVFWDGRDAEGRLLPPGLYLVDLEVQAESRSKRQLRPVGLAY